MPHQIIDNRTRKLADEINQQLEYTEKAKIAVGYFFLSGLESIEKRLQEKEPDGSFQIKEVRLLIGNVSNKSTIEELARGYRRLNTISKELERQNYPKSRERQIEVLKALNDVRDVISDVEQNDENQRLIQLLHQMIVEQRLKVKVYVKSRLHAKAYIFDFKNPQPQSKGIAIVGSSNLSLAGLTNNTELNVYVHDNGENHDELTRWFDNLWNDAEDFDTALFQEMAESWAIRPTTPYEIYIKTLYELVKDRIEGTDDREFLWQNEITEALTDFQNKAVKIIIGIIRQYGGAFASDVVGIGKSFIGAAVVKHFSITENAKPLIICPKSLEDMWRNYNAEYSLNAEVLPMSLLRESISEDDEWNLLVSDVKYRDRDFILIDESHHFRHQSPERYKILQDFMQTGNKKVLLLTATPRNKSAMDVYNQIKLFHTSDTTIIPINPPNLKDYFKKIQDKNTPTSEAKNLFRSLLQFILVRRTRQHILKWYGFDSKTHLKVDPNKFEDYVSGKKRAYISVGGRAHFFPKREIDTVRYSIAKTYQGLYGKIRRHLGKAKFDYKKEPVSGELTFARFALWHYVKPEMKKEKPYNELQRAGANLRGLIRILLFKRFESSVYAFRMTIGRLIKIHQAFLLSLENGVIPAGEEAQKLLATAELFSEENLLNELKKVTGKYNANAFDLERLKTHIRHDLNILNEISRVVSHEEIPPEKDDKLQTLTKILNDKPLVNGKVLIFSESAETVEYLHNNLNQYENPQIRKVSSGTENKGSLVNRFAPKANKYTLKKGDVEIRMLIATDVLSEGLNLHDCDKVINYDLHWNPVKLIQRFGRIDRIGSEFDSVYGFNFLPETELDANLELHKIIRKRIQEIHDTIGEDAQILDPDEQVNTEAMYAIYEKDSAQLALFEEETESMGLNEAEEIIRKLKEENPEEYGRISHLRHGIRSAVHTNGATFYVFCQAGQYNQLLLVDKTGKVISRDVIDILGKLRFISSQPPKLIPQGYNRTIQAVKLMFDREIENRTIEIKHAIHLSISQKYVINELRVLFEKSDNDDLKAQISLLEKAFRTVDRIAINQELNKIRHNHMTGMALVNRLTEIYTRHNLAELDENNLSMVMSADIPKVICSEVF